MITIERILCPIDFSGSSERALDYAAATARWYEARLDVLHVHHELPVVDIIPSLSPNPAEQLAARDDTHAQIQELAAGLVQRVEGTGVLVDLAVKDERDVHRGILDYAAERDSDLIVMGSHGRSGVERWLLGSVTEKIVRRARCPVLVVPPQSSEAAAPAGDVEFDSILCAVDFSDGSRAALAYATSLAEEADAQLTILNVIEVPPELEEHDFASPFDVNQVRAEAQARRLDRLRALVPEAAREFCEVHAVVSEGSAYREILREALGRRSDVIVMGTQGRGAVDRLVFGSNTSQVVRAAQCPVLTVPTGVKR